MPGVALGRPVGWCPEMTGGDDAAAWKARGEEMARRQREGRRCGPPEPVYRYVLEFECTPSTFDRVKSFVGERVTANRTYRYYPTKREGM